MHRSQLIAFLLLLSMAASSSFNVDVVSRVVHRAPKNSCPGNNCMFGFSVAQHREQGKPWFLVGAPTADSGQPGVDRGGAVFKCSPTGRGECQLIPFDTSGNKFAANGQQYDAKSGQWFGATVTSAGDDKLVLACAPLYVYYLFVNRRDPVGACFAARDDFTRFARHRPCLRGGGMRAKISLVHAQLKEKGAGGNVLCREKKSRGLFRILPMQDTSYLLCLHCKSVIGVKTELQRIIMTKLRASKWGYHKQGSCQAGLGAAIAEEGEMVFVGAPGSWYWQGQVYAFNASNSRGPKQGGKLNLGSHKGLTNVQGQVKTSEGSPADDDSYLGYSVATGDFDGDGVGADVAVGMPRGAELNGKVLIYDTMLNNLHNLTGEQIGAYFGYSLASGDVNGDGLDDLIIGAPMFTNYAAAEMMKYETGRVYVVYQDANHRFRRFDTLDGGNAPKARFGHAIACAGNLNLDVGQRSGHSIEDIVIGAPYEAGGGAIYVYLGGDDGVRRKYAQRISAGSVGGALRTFGWALDAGKDMDGNGYPDILVGAYESGEIVALKAAPVIHMQSKVSFRAGPNNHIDLERKQCSVRGSQAKVPCFDADIEMKYSGEGVPQKMDFELQYVLDTKKGRAKKRMYFTDREGVSSYNRTVTMYKGRTFADTFSVYLPAGAAIKDKLSTLDVQVLYSLAASSSSVGGLRPVLGQFENTAANSVAIKKDCGADGLCIPNLSVQALHQGSYVVGGKERMEISTEISNRGEDAFNTMLYLQIPRGVNYIGANTSNAQVSLLCSAPNAFNNRTLQCEVGNPLPAGAVVDARVFLQPTEAAQDLPLSEYVFSLAVNSSNSEEATSAHDNRRLVRIPVAVETDWRATGTSKPAQIEYNISVAEEELPDKYEDEEEIGAEILHVYNIKNRGPSAIHEAEVFLLWPSFDANDDHLLYLLGVDYDTRRVQCKPIKDINPLYVRTHSSESYAYPGMHQRQHKGTVGAVDTTSGGGSHGTYEEQEIRTSTYDGHGGSYGGGSYYYRGGGSYDRGNMRGGGSSSDVDDGHGWGAEGREKTSYEYESTFYSSSESSAQTYESSTTAAAPSSDSDSGWKLLRNGSYIRIYDSSSTTGAHSVGGGADFDSSDSGWIRLPDGSLSRKLSSWSSWSSSSNELDSDGGFSGKSKLQGGGVSSSTSSGTYYYGASSSGVVGGSSHTSSGRSSGGTQYSGSRTSHHGSASSSSSTTVHSGGSGGFMGGRGSSGGTVSSSVGDVSSSGQHGSSSTAAHTGSSTRWTENSGAGRTGSSSHSHSTEVRSGSVASSSSRSATDADAHVDSGSTAVDGKWVWSKSQQKWLWKAASRSAAGGQNRGSVPFDRNVGGETTFRSRQSVASWQSQGSSGATRGGSSRTGYGGGGGGAAGEETRVRGGHRDRVWHAGGRDSSYTTSGRWSSSSSDPLSLSPQGTVYGQQPRIIDESYFNLKKPVGGQGRGHGHGHDRDEYFETGHILHGGRGGGGGARRRQEQEGGTLSEDGSWGRSRSESKFTVSGREATAPASNKWSGRSHPGGSKSRLSNQRSSGASSGFGSSSSLTGREVSVSSSSRGGGRGRGSSLAAVVGHETGDLDHNSTGWVPQPDGTVVHKTTSWASWSTSSKDASPGARGDGTHQRLDGVTRSRAASKTWSGSHVGSFSSASSQSTGIGSSSSSSRHKSSSSLSGHSGGRVKDSRYSNSAADMEWRGGSGGHSASWEQDSSRGSASSEATEGDGHETGDLGHNSTGWVRQPDGTMVRKTTSWASWSLSSEDTSQGVGGERRERLNQVHREMEEKLRQRMDRLKTEDHQTRTESRIRRHASYEEFQAELDDCASNRCTLMQCTVGPLAKDESVSFKIRSRLFTETQIKTYAEKVKISSKMVARITRLPYMADPRKVPCLMHQVTTEVFPSDLPEAAIPWWVWLLAAIFGLLLLALIICCLCKCGFFKRHRPI